MASLGEVYEGKGERKLGAKSGEGGGQKTRERGKQTRGRPKGEKSGRGGFCLWERKNACTREGPGRSGIKGVDTSKCGDLHSLFRLRTGAVRR